MRRLRFSVGGLMVVVLLLAAAFAALRWPTPLMANLWFSLTLSALVLAIPAAVYRRAEDRAFWVGFAAAGWAYFVLALVPWFQSEFGFQLVTTTILDVVAPFIVQKEYLVRTYIAAFYPPFAPGEPTPWQVWNLPELPPDNPWHKAGYVTLHSPGLYLRIGHTMFCLVIALLAGEIVRWFAATRTGPSAQVRQAEFSPRA
jgi:hypothetical protein